MAKKFDCYLKPPTVWEITFEDAEKLADERRRLYATIMSKCLDKKLRAEDLTFAQVTDSLTDRLTFFCSALAMSKSRKWKSLESILLYWRIIMSCSSLDLATLEVKVEHTKTPPSTHLPELKCSLCKTTHDLVSHLGEYAPVAQTFVTSDGRRLSPHDFALLKVEEFNKRKFPTDERFFENFKKV